MSEWDDAGGKKAFIWLIGAVTLLFPMFFLAREGFGPSRGAFVFFVVFLWAFSRFLRFLEIW